MQMQRNRRRKRVVNPVLQGRIVKSVSWPPALCLALAACVVGIFSARLNEEALAADVELENLAYLFLTVGAFLVAALAFVIVNSLYFSHRIAGPAYRIERTLEQVRGGDATARVRLRQGDFLVEVAAATNEFLEWVESSRPAVRGFSRADTELPVSAEAETVQPSA